MHVLWWIIVGLIAGWATGKIMRGSGYGPMMDILIGIVGAIGGGWIMRALGFQGHGGMIYTILVAIGGAVVLTWFWRLAFGRRDDQAHGTEVIAGEGCIVTADALHCHRAMAVHHQTSGQPVRVLWHCERCNQSLWRTYANESVRERRVRYH